MGYNSKNPQCDSVLKNRDHTGESEAWIKMIRLSDCGQQVSMIMSFVFQESEKPMYNLLFTLNQSSGRNGVSLL